MLEGLLSVVALFSLIGLDLQAAFHPLHFTFLLGKLGVTSFPRAIIRTK